MYLICIEHIGNGLVSHDAHTATKLIYYCLILFPLISAMPKIKPFIFTINKNIKTISYKTPEASAPIRVRAVKNCYV